MFSLATAKCTGKTKWFLLYAYLDPSRISFNGFAVDINERRLAEIALAESEVLQSAVLNSTEDLIWSVEPEHFRMLTFNRGLADYYAQQGHQLERGQAHELLRNKEDSARWREFYERALREGALSLEYETLRDHRVLSLSFHVLRRNNEIIGISVFGRDITKRKRAEATLRQNNERNRTILKTAMDGYWLAHKRFEAVF